MQRRHFQHDGLTLSYLDAGGAGPVLIALPAHWMEGVTFAPLARALAPNWRVVALDQRGHGRSDHAPRETGYTRDAYLGDVAALYTHLGVHSAVLLGNSLGGVNAYQFARRNPDQVRALVIEDIGVVVADDTSFALSWGGTYPTREALVERVGARFLPYLEDAIRETSAGWRLAFDPQDTVASQRELNGDYWADWLATICPALLIRGRDSRVTKPEMLEQMAARRPNTRLVTLDGGHVVHLDNPTGFADAVLAFLAAL
jgi:pimeloyl-ACP methyl ester carboxylesterase